MTHYFSEKQDSKFQTFNVKIRLKTLPKFELISARGVFSKDGLDNGSKLLIENAKIKKGGKVLDIGCGYGVVGISIAKMHNANILMTDLNERAVKLSKMNVKKHDLLDQVKVKKSDLYQKIEGEFDAILANPPQTAGKKVCFGIITGAYNHLKQNKTLQLVARHQKGGKELEKKMNETFGNVSQIAKGSGFRVYLSKKA